MTKIDLWNILLNYSIDPPSFPLLRNNIIKLSRKYIISFVQETKLTYLHVRIYSNLWLFEFQAQEILKFPLFFKVGKSKQSVVICNCIFAI